MPGIQGIAKAATWDNPAFRKYSVYPIRYEAAGTATLLPTLAGSGSRPASGSAVTPRGVTGNAGAPAGPPPPPTPMAGATMTGRVIGAIGRCAAAIPTPGSASTTVGPAGPVVGGISSGGSCIRGSTPRRPDRT